MALYATRNLIGPHGEPIETNGLIPESWALGSPFVAECVQYGWIVSLDEPPSAATPPPDPTAVHVGGAGKRSGNAPRPHAEN